LAKASAARQLAGVGLALVAQDVVLVHDQECLGQPGEFLDGGSQR
jgi:hypothetical protein